MKFSAVLLSLAVAQDGDGAQGGAQAQGAQGDGGDGYGQEPQQQGYAAPAQADSYAAPEANYAESYAAPLQIHVEAEICLGGCPPEAPCQSKFTGACSARLQAASYAAASYAAPVQQAYGDEQQSYSGEAQQGYSGEAQQQGNQYRQLSEGTCPKGTFDTTDGKLGSTVILWIGFALLAIPAFFFFCCNNDIQVTNQLANQRVNGPNGIPIGTSNDPTGIYNTGQTMVRIETTTGYGMHRTVAGIICFIASIAYLTMALGYGFMTRCCDGRQFYYARYIDWTLTTPLLLFEILDVSQTNGPTRTFIYFIDVVMIISGLIGSLVCGSEKWMFFGFSMLTFLPIMVLLCGAQRRFTHYNLQVFNSVKFLIIISWSFYPIVWILAEGSGMISAQVEACLYTVLDIFAKSFLGFLFVRNPFAFSFFTQGTNAAKGTSLGETLAPGTTTQAGPQSALMQ